MVLEAASDEFLELSPNLSSNQSGMPSLSESILSLASFSVVAEYDGQPPAAEGADGRWINFGGQPVREADADRLRDDIREGRLDSWDDIHRRLDALWTQYPQDRAANALRLFEHAAGREIDGKVLRDLLDEERSILKLMVRRAEESRAKDFSNTFRAATCRNLDEQTAVFGSLDDDPALARLRDEVAESLMLIGDFLT